MAAEQKKSLAYATFEVKGEAKPWEFELHELGAEDVELKLTHSGVCHSDIHSIDGDWGIPNFPLVAGHELLGEVTAVGANVTKFKIGDRIGVGPQANSCGACRQCQRNSETYCTAGMVQTYNSKLPDGYITKGGYAQYHRTNAKFAFKIPENLDPAGAAPLLCAGVTVFTPLKECGVDYKSKVAVVGLGGLGHVALKIARAMGAEVTAISTSASKEAECKSFGAHEFIVSTDDAQMAAAAGQFDVILNTSSASLDWAKYLSLLQARGTWVQLGAPPCSIGLAPFQLIFKGISFRGSLIGSPRDFEDMFELCGRHNIVCAVETVPVSKINEALQKVRDNKARYRMVLTFEEM